MEDILGPGLYSYYYLFIYFILFIDSDYRAIPGLTGLEPVFFLVNDQQIQITFFILGVIKYLCSGCGRLSMTWNADR